MSRPTDRSVLESLESRRYAASHERIGTTIGDPVRSSTIIQFAAGEKVDVTRIPRLRVLSGASRAVVVQGDRGNDNVRVRLIHGSLELWTSTRQTYRYFSKSGKPIEATSTYDNVFRFAANDFASLTINGGKGFDSLRYAADLPYNPEISSIESELPRTYAPAPARATPSHAAVRDQRWWLARVRKDKEDADAAVSTTAFFGDSYVENFLTTGIASWTGYFRKAKNFGIGGDDTRNALSRIRSGLFDQYKPKKLVVSIGTNNFNNPKIGGTDAEIFTGVMRVMYELRKRLPDAKIVLISLLPRSAAGLKARIETLNARLDAAAGSTFTFLNLYERFSNNAYAKVNGKKGGTYDVVLVGTDSHYTRQGYSGLAYHLDRLLGHD